MRLMLPLALLPALTLPISVAAQEGPGTAAPHGQVAIGVGAVPEYDGSEDLRVIPFALADVRWQGLTLELRGLRGRLDVAADPRFAIGPVIGARLNRSDADGPVRLLPEIDTAVEAGGFIGYRFGGDQLGEGSLLVELTAVHDVSRTHNGLLATASASYTAMRQPDYFLSFDLQSTWASADYTRTYFGVTPADAVRSGLRAFRPGSGIRDVGGGVSAGYYFSQRMGVVARLGSNYLVGDTADSPITDVGRRWQPAGGLTLSYRF